MKLSATTPNLKNVLLLVLCQALFMTANTILFTIAALVGQSLASDKTLSTLPLALLQLATMVMTVPASLSMQRWGRRAGFMIGLLIGIGGAGLGIAAIVSHSFNLFCGATILLGGSNSFAGFYRFAAAEAAAEAFRSQAISLVISGGVVAALVGPQLASWSKDWGDTFTGSFATMALLLSLSLGFLFPLQMPRLTIPLNLSSRRPWLEILRQPTFGVAALGSMIGYGVMVLVMTATPLAIVAKTHAFNDAAQVLQWHVLGMFAPSFVTGSLIARFGVLTLMSCGCLLSLIALGINLIGTELLNYTIALLSLGIGWNFLFIGATTLLTETYLPAEKAAVQAVHDFLMFAFVAAATFLSGHLFQLYGWKTVNWAGVPLLLLLLVAISWLKQIRSSHQPVSDQP